MKGAHALGNHKVVGLIQDRRDQLCDQNSSNAGRLSHTLCCKYLNSSILQEYCVFKMKNVG